MIGNIFRTFFKVLGYAFFAIIAGVMLFAGFAWFVYNYVPWEDKKIEREFNKRLEEKMAAGETKIYLKDLTDFEWGRICYISADNEEDLREKIVSITYNKSEFYVPFLCGLDGCHNLLFLSKNHHLINLNPKDFSILCPESKQGGFFSLRCCTSKAFVKLTPREMGEEKFVNFAVSEDKEP